MQRKDKDLEIWNPKGKGKGDKGGKNGKGSKGKNGKGKASYGLFKRAKMRHVQRPFLAPEIQQAEGTSL
jgi:hypothetical protein